MTTRIPNWRNERAGDGEASEASAKEDVRTGRQDESAHILATPQAVTEAMVDEAVSNVVRARGIRADAAEALKATLGRDASGGPMNAYYTSKAAATRARMVGVGRKDLIVTHVLEEDEVLALTDYATEFRLRFHNVESHDHAMAAATRKVDNMIIAQRLPLGVKMSDIGGNPMTYIKAEASDWHVCGPRQDKKDPVRHKLRRLEAARMYEDDPGSKRGALAKAYLDGDEQYGCGMHAQKCNVQTPIGIAVHVYDIPMRDWPMIMERKALSIVEGCVLFSPRFFEETQGTLGVSKARFEIDAARDTFRMGFSNSPSWWYSHKLSEFLMYGVDQLITRGRYTYSYKVIERRGDTYFYRILRLPVNLSGEKRFSSYRLPGVPVVQVHGFELQSVRGGAFQGPLEKKDYFFPQNLWGEMVAQASEDFERGVMDFNKMYNHYRTISVRHTINAVLVMGGEQVSAEELVPLVVHSCLAAAAQSLLAQRETRALTEMEMRRRGYKDKGTMSMVLTALGAMTKSVVLAPLYPLRVLAGYLADMHFSSVDQWILDWEPVSRIVTVEVATLLASGSAVVQAITAAAVYDKSAADTAPFDHYAAAVTDRRLASVVAKLIPGLDMGPEPSSDVGESVPGGATAPPSYVTDVPAAKPSTVGLDGMAVRLAAIQEHIEEARLQNRAVAYTCAEAYRKLSVGGEPSRSSLVKYAELYRNPDFWRVENGVIAKSVLGLDPENFAHSAVYHPTPDGETGEAVRAVHRSEWQPGGGGKANKNFLLSDNLFCGWVFVCDDLVVYNGPEIISALQKALGLTHDYEVKLHWGVPGCGKTYSIVQGTRDTGEDMVLCPVRESTEDTRGEVLKRYPGFPKPKTFVKTVDSYLVNLNTDKNLKGLEVARVMADECFMAHAAKWYAVAALLGAKEIWAYGDDKQIPHIPRVQSPKLHVKLKHQALEENFVTRRCPATAVAAWGSVYEWKARTVSLEIGTMVEVRETKGMEVPKGCVMMCMYQADKKEIKKLYPMDLRHIKIMTAHESEGKTFDHVWLHRFDLRKRSDNLSLFDQQPHVLVAMSRHRRGFVYRCPAVLGDLVSQWVGRSSDPRRIAAARDSDTAGQSCERL